MKFLEQGTRDNKDERVDIIRKAPVRTKRNDTSKQETMEKSFALKHGFLLQKTFPIERKKAVKKITDGKGTLWLLVKL